MSFGSFLRKFRYYINDRHLASPLLIVKTPILTGIHFQMPESPRSALAPSPPEAFRRMRRTAVRTTWRVRRMRRESSVELATIHDSCSQAVTSSSSLSSLTKN